VTDVVILTRAKVPAELARAWLQHLRNFDTAHSGCHFEVLADAGDLPLGTVVEMVRLNPALTFTQVMERKKTEP